MGPATETAIMTDTLLKATEGNGLESSYKMFLEVKKILMHWDGNSLEDHSWFAPTCFAKRNFWSCTEREHELARVQSILRPGVGRPAGMWKAQPLELGIEPEVLAARVFPSSGDCEVFVFLLSLSHSFISSETYWFTVRLRGKNNPAITKCHCEMEKLGFT